MEEMFEQIETKLSSIPKFLLDPILKKKTLVASKNIRDNKFTTLKILKGDIFKVKQQNSESRRNSSLVNEKRGSQHQDEEMPHNIKTIMPPDLQHLYKQTEGVHNLQCLPSDPQHSY
ncbi:hypothetical protein MA16_Dca018419 [Dendrobium catenatum]|uniref:Uncharacterized protein n=1 Tax=Dendrobium catenatum TaxID=906689 RepID=A0A2I0WHP4_9ASPA|nr:hypothetical protein MA16_Dca018419 [Dendrobium catenatum]